MRPSESEPRSGSTRQKPWHISKTERRPTQAIRLPYWPARTHLEQAFRLAPQEGLVANNLAWLLAQPPSPDLPRALALIDSVLARWPDQPNYLETRGQILVKLQRWNEALADLEMAQQRGL